MQLRHVFFVPMILTLLAATTLQAKAAGRVQLELVGDAVGAGLSFQQWVQVLSRAGVKNVRIRAAGATDKIGIVVRGTPDSPLYVVTGVVRSGDELLLPGGRYRRTDAARLARWLDDLARFGPKDGRPAKSAFGLTGEQFEQIREDLSGPVGFSTREMPRHEAVERIDRQLHGPLQIDPGLVRLLKEDKIAEELSSLSCGTSLAYVLRPVGLCMVPRVRAGRPVYELVAAKPGLEVWPVGWEPEGRPRDVLPAAFVEFHNINVESVSATVALQAIAGRLKIPVLIDHNALARWGIDPDKASVSHPRRRTTYSIALRKLLSQAGLKSEFRLDEADNPFLWVTSIKPM